jgi:DNA repair protein RadC
MISTREAVRLAKKLIRDRYKEHFIAIYLNSRNEVIKTELVSMGTLNANLVHPREVFRPALICRACGVIVLHNHPSNVPDPSESDVEVTKRLTEAGKLLGIDLLDHVVFTSRKNF